MASFPPPFPQVVHPDYPADVDLVLLHDGHGAKGAAVAVRAKNVSAIDHLGRTDEKNILTYLVSD